MLKIDWKPTKKSSVSLHIQIYDYLKKKIMNGEWVIGTKVPPQRELAKVFEVNRSTIIQAIDELIADGLIESKVGSGTRVVNNTWNLLASSPPPDWISYVQAGIHEPNLSIIQKINQAESNPNMIRLGTGELSPNLLPSEQMKNLLQEQLDQNFTLSYIEPKGSPSLRQAVSEYIKSKGIEASPQSILIVSGGLQTLQLISMGLLKRGSTILHESPSYLHSVHVFQSAGMNLFGIPMDDEGIQCDSIGRLKRQHNGALLYTIPSFHNPTGGLMTEKRRKKLLEVSKKESLPMIEDDVYGDLWFEDPPPKPLKAHDTLGNVLYIGSISKTLSPGLRIGWIVGPEPVVDRLADIKMQTDYGSSSLSQYVVEKWLSTGIYHDYIEQVRKELKVRRDFTLHILKNHFSDLASWNIPKGGFYIWLCIRANISIRTLFESALQEKILINPGVVYDRHDQQHLRISYSYASLDEIEKGLLCLSQLIRILAKNE
ncbi:PLP-dependent aminotransferase family protein [Niallia sp. Krafla_26]|uniref:aminotransferase-like domain-containing protein n=1 Tax=Niallia sp. Krafla_26 TaxID=3064703 RepID=UPI003D17E048